MSGTIRRLLFVTDACSFGGAERYVLDMAAAARRRDIEPAICWLPWSNAPSALFGAATRQRIPLVHSATTGPRGRGERLRILRTALKDLRPDALIVNASGRPRFWYTCWQARLAGLPTVWVHHMVEQQDPRRARPKWFGGTVEGPQWWRVPQALRHRLAAQAATVVITSNAADRDRVARWHNVNPTKVRVIAPGIDATRFQYNANASSVLRHQWLAPAPSPPLARGGQGGSGQGRLGPETPEPREPFIIGTAARLVARKGIEPLIEATAQLRSRGIPAVLIIAGQGPQQAAFEAQAKAHNLTDAVRFIGFTEDMPAFHSALDVFALCSETESFGLALAEALACARPVVATPTDGARRQLRHLDNGWQLSTFSPAELTDALAALYAAPPLRERLAQQARAGIEREFTIDHTLDETLRALSPACPAHDHTNCSRTTSQISGVVSPSL